MVRMPVLLLGLLFVGRLWAQVDSAYIRMKEQGISPPYVPPPPGTPLPLTNPASDCPGAIRICQATYNFAQAVPNFGNVQELPNGNNTCLSSGERRSVWFLFTIQQGGTVGFIIDPQSSTDYDFALWDVTGLSNPCNAIGTQPIRCNFAASTAQTNCCRGYTGGPGITGLDHNTVSSNPIRHDAGDPPIMPGLPVNAGQTFLLVVNNFSNTNQGYIITFTGTAQYFDNGAPRMDSVYHACASSHEHQIDYLRQIVVRFNELINPTSIAADGSDFAVEDVASGALIPVTAATPLNPQQTNSVRLTLGATLVPGNTYRVRIGYNPPGSGSQNGRRGSDGNTIGDQCGIYIPVTDIPPGSSADLIEFVARDTIVPSITLTIPSCTVQNDGQISVSATGATPPYEYSLLPGYPTWRSNGTFTGLAAGNYTLRVRDSGGCIVTRSFTVQNRDPLTMQLTGITPIRCAGGTGGFAVEAGGGTAPYTYTLVGQGVTNNTGSFSGLRAGTYTIRAEDATRSRCGQLTVELTEPAPLELQNNTTRPITCRGGSDGQIQVTITGGTQPYTYNWQAGSGQNLPANAPTVQNLQGGTYTLTITDANGCSIGPFSFSLSHTNEVRIDSVGYAAQTDCPEDREYLFAIRAQGTGPLTYRWTWEDGTTETGTDLMRRTYPPSFQGTVTIKVQVEIPGPCYADTTFRLRLQACTPPPPVIGVSIPTAFTPNGDGINDTWSIQAIGVIRYTLVVFDRWGKEVFNNGGDMTRFWDGTINGQPAPEGIYVYTLEALYPNNQKVSRTGTVTLLR